ncbi:uncharacterized protein LOC121388722 [Gigantopelta aegis]|uniref:uncharacterized protein LOC121388722 n=1 Tax=Gigantopelta aegis TaxID=1735272 RepID=UPI001B8880DB|nr:uncharacterized protein LOC121388722 [Gigantopelta aegis]
MRLQMTCFQNWHSTLLWNSFILLISLYSAAAYKCSRDGSKIVRNVILDKIKPAFWQQIPEYIQHIATSSFTKMEMPKTCPFYLQRELFFLQEERKVVEGANRWKCNICGKAFITEHFLDKHFDNRHRDWIREGNDSVCLSDYCDIFRCDILSHSRRPDFWDVALCLEDDMQEVFEKCMTQMKQCMPSESPGNWSAVLSGLLHDRVCSYLTCNKYWDIPQQQRHSEGLIAFYIISSVLVGFGLVVYYCIFYQYYYTDAFADSVVPESYSRNQRHEELRHRNSDRLYDFS